MEKQDGAYELLVKTDYCNGKDFFFQCFLGHVQTGQKVLN